MSAFVTSSSFTGALLRSDACSTDATSPLKRRTVPRRYAPAVLPPCPSTAAPATVLTPPRASVTVERLANRSFQLEEDEDSLSCTSAIYLSEDGHLAIGKTDGPRPDSVEATWKFNDSDGELVMDIKRYFSGDGKVPFCVRRVLRGHLDPTGANLRDLPTFSGAMYQYPADYSKHSEVGWWAMILAVDDLPTADFDISASQ